MADFARWVTAAEPGLKWELGTFMGAYRDNRSDANALTVEAAAIGPVLIRFIKSRKQWQGTAIDLLNSLEEEAEFRLTVREDWPKTPRKIAGDLRRIAPSLRALGYDVEFLKESSRKRSRLICLSKAGAKKHQSKKARRARAKRQRFESESKYSSRKRRKK